MNRRRSSRSLTVPARRELEIAAAVAREKIIQFHVSSALRMIALAGARVPLLRMLDIYLRLHWVKGPEAELLANRVLAAMGDCGASAPAIASDHPASEPDEDADSLWRVVRSRIRGRVHHELRRHIELAAGAAQAGIVHIHVEHAVRFVRHMERTHTVAEAGAVYAEMVAMPAPLQPAFHVSLVNRIASEELPRISLLGVADPPDESRAGAPGARLGRRQVG